MLRLQPIVEQKPVIYRVEEKKEKKSFSQDRHDESKKKNEAQEETVSSWTQEQLEQAVSELEEKNGLTLHAKIKKQAKKNDLKVHIQDSEGKLVRELTAQEFLSLRDQLLQGEKRGALLDAKG